MEKLKALKKNDEINAKMKAADDRALKMNDRDRQKKEYPQNSRGNYKTNETRNHNPPHHHIQQPKK